MKHVFTGRFCIYEIVLNVAATLVAVLVMYVHSQAEFMARPPRWLLLATFVKQQKSEKGENQTEFGDKSTIGAETVTQFFI